MVCIYCGSKTRVSNSRPQKRTGSLWRRRECKHCHAVFTTSEQIALSDTLRVRKRSGEIERFERDKLFLSIHRSCEHLRQPVNTSRELSATVLVRLFAKKPMSPIIETKQIAAIIVKVLHAYDEPAATRYLSFQKSKS